MKTLLQENYTRSNGEGQADFQNNFEEYKHIFQETRRLGDIHQVDKVFKCVIKILQQVVEFSGAAFIEKEKFADHYHLKNEYKLNSKLDKHLRWLERSGYLKWVSESDTVSLIPPDDEIASNHPLLIIPLLTGKKIIGALVVFLKINSKDITSNNSDLLTLIGSQAGVAFENARLYEEMATKSHVLSSMKSFMENSIESVGDGIIAIDLDKKISLFNSAAVEILGPQHDTAIGLRYNELFDQEFVDFLDQLFDLTLTKGENRDEFSYRNPISKKRFLMEIYATILKNDEGEKIGAIAVCRDLTEQQELTQLRQLDQLKDEFISTVSHELRTPLTSIKSFTGILKDLENCDAKSQRAFLDIIEKESDRLIQLIEELLDISKINRGEFNSEIGFINIKAVFKKSLFVLQAVAGAKRINFEADFNGNEIVLSDEKRLIQVFVNLIGNAIKFSPDGGIIKKWKEKIKSNGMKDKCNYLKISIKDEGIGIPKESRTIVFEKFKQLRDDPSTKPSGSGLGLWLCKKIIEEHEGTIWVESEPNKGSTFIFTLPNPD